MSLPLLAPLPDGVKPDDWEAACGAVRSYCRWHIAPSVTQTVKINGRGGHVLVLKTKMLTELTSITSDGNAVADPDWCEEGIVERRDGCWSHRLGGVEVTMTHGFETCPPEVEAILADLAKAAHLTGAGSMQAGPFQVGFGSGSAVTQAGGVGLSLEQKRVLTPYRIEPSF